jgi:hypothetical protein
MFSKPRSATVLAATALVVAVFGSTPLGHAAGRLVLPKGSVGAKQLKTNAVTGLKVLDGTLTAGDFRAGQLPAGAKGDKGDKGDQGEPGASRARPARSALRGRRARRELRVPQVRRDRKGRRDPRARRDRRAPPVRKGRPGRRAERGERSRGGLRRREVRGCGNGPGRQHRLPDREDAAVRRAKLGGQGIELTSSYYDLATDEWKITIKTAAGVPSSSYNGFVVCAYV